MSGRFHSALFSATSAMFEFSPVLAVVLALLAAVSPGRADEYVEEALRRCNETQKALSCAKYKVLRLLDDYRVRDVNITSDSSVKLVGIPDPEAGDVQLFGSRQFATDSEVGKMFKFAQRKLQTLLMGHGIVVDLPAGARLMEDGKLLGMEGRRKKKTAQFLIPLLMLFKLFKIKVLVSLVLAGIFFIKKTILAAALILPSVVQSIKNHCKHQSAHHYTMPYHTYETDYHHVDGDHHDASSGFGFSG